MFVKRHDPSTGGLRWSLYVKEICYCQGVVAPKQIKPEPVQVKAIMHKMTNYGLQTPLILSFRGQIGLPQSWINYLKEMYFVVSQTFFFSVLSRFFFSDLSVEFTKELNQRTQ